MDPDYVLTHLENDRRHWWFRGRLAVLLAVLRHVLQPGRHRLLELGCGTGNVLGELREFGEIIGMERDSRLVAEARSRGLEVREGMLPGSRVVEPGWADVVLLLDVIEHLDDDAATLRAAHAALTEGGLLVITVPAYRWLWSSHDVVLGHRRRYTPATLSAVVQGAGFRVTRLSHFNALLLPALVTVRLWKRLAGQTGHDLSLPAPVVNRALERVFALERHIVPRVSLPLGSSLLLLARR